MHELNCATPLPYNHHPHTHTHTHTHTHGASGGLHICAYIHTHTNAGCRDTYMVQVGPFGDGWGENVVSVVTTPAALLHPSPSSFSPSVVHLCLVKMVSPSISLSLYLLLSGYGSLSSQWQRLEKSKRSSSRFFFSFLDGIPLFHSFWWNFLESFKELEFLLHILDICLSVFVWVCVFVCVCVVSVGTWLMLDNGSCGVSD